MKVLKHCVFSLLSSFVILLAASTVGFGQVKPYTGGPNSNGTAAAFFAIDGTQTRVSYLNYLQNDEFTVRAFVDLRNLNGTDGNSNTTAVALSSIQLVVRYDPSILELESPTISTSNCTNSSLNPIFVGASGRFSNCGLYSYGKDSNNTFSPNATGIVSILSYTTDTTDLPTGLVALPAFKFRVLNVSFTSTAISLNPAVPSPTTFAGASYDIDCGIGFTSTDLTIARTPTPGTGTVAISGTEQSVNDIHGWHYNTGTVSITVNGYTATVPFDGTSTSASVAAALRNYFNTHTDSPVTATLSGSTLTLTAKTPGSDTNYAISTSNTSVPYNNFFAQASFAATASGSTLTGGN